MAVPSCAAFMLPVFRAFVFVARSLKGAVTSLVLWRLLSHYRVYKCYEFRYLRDIYNQKDGQFFFFYPELREMASFLDAGGEQRCCRRLPVNDEKTSLQSSGLKLVVRRRVPTSSTNESVGTIKRNAILFYAVEKLCFAAVPTAKLGFMGYEATICAMEEQ